MFEEREKSKQEVDLILDNMIFAKKTVDCKSPKLYYFIYWKKENHVEDTWEPIERVCNQLNSLTI